ncbi:hypothetical protein ACFFJ4_00465 [Xanthomonas dyei]|jgi:predicted transcriptional regulator|uniref:Ribbon-helix-helix protein CopG domain-containing protein n=1 Tax=Xanthomonas dyei TaxID=743699 RepID=A0A2S7CBK5_9XANT|nr:MULTISPECIES: hypothetical protein [Xanthomonas]MEA9605760.1 hypothetical protein [Xanthomonas campestris pv. plantaginis]PPU58957.1 hypothetical protein XdyCFBP7245_00460 [Xanthomonas dyei]
MSEKTKITVNLSEEVTSALKSMAQERSTSVTEVLRHAISTEKFLLNEVKQGGKVLIKDRDGNMRELIFR